jgi:hypothetical protein
VPLRLQYTFEVIYCQKHIATLFTEYFCEVDGFDCQHIHAHISLFRFFYLSAAESPGMALLDYFHCFWEGSRIEV